MRKFCAKWLKVKKNNAKRTNNNNNIELRLLVNDETQNVKILKRRPLIMLMIKISTKPIGVYRISLHYISCSE